MIKTTDTAPLSMHVVDHKEDVDITGKTFVCYIIEVTGMLPAISSEEILWTIRKRYTEFYQFYKALVAACHNEPEVSAFNFPHKSLFHNHDIRTIERRKQGFEELLSLAQAVQPLLLMDFLQVSAPEDHRSLSESPIRASSASPDISCIDTIVTSQNGMDTADDQFQAVVMASIPEDELLEPLDFKRALLRIRKVEALNLKKVEFLGENDPFVTLAFDKWRGRTKTMHNAGSDVAWQLEGQSKFEFEVTIDSLERLQLRLAAHDDNDISSSVEIGKGSSSLAKILSVGMDVETSVTVYLKDSKNKPSGHVIVYFDLVDHPDDIADNEKKINENGVVIAVFYIALYEMLLLVYVLWTFDYSTLYDLFLAVLRRELMRLTVCSQLTLILIVVFLYFHRFLGWATTWYLKSIMGTPSEGYNMEFSWISLRLGLDESEIVLKNFIWYNTPVFKESPYFVKIKRMCIRFDPASIYPAITRNDPIQISDIEINGVTAYVERDDKHGLNIWACMGSADQPPEEKKIESSVVGNVASAMKKNKDGAENGILKPKNFLKKKQSSEPNLEDIGDVSDINFEDAEDDSVPQKPASGLSRENSVILNADGSKKTNGWGVPYKFVTGRLEIRNLRAYAQDYLNAKHSSYSKLTSITVKRMDMVKKELCDYSSSKGYRGVFLDDLVWKMIGELITSLLASNSGSLALLAASAAANNTFALAKGTTGFATKGVIESLHNYNPHKVMGSTFRKTSSLFRGEIVVKQDEELAQQGYTSVCGRIISVRNLRRKGAKVDSVYCTVTLLGSEAYDNGSYKTYVRSGNSDFTASFNEKFELKPLSSLSQGIAIKIFDKKLARLMTADKLIVEAVIPDLRNLSIVGRGEEVVSWIELSSDGMFEDTGDIQIALQLK